MRKTLSCLLVLGVAGCLEIKTDPGEGSGLAPGPTVEFDPADAILPFPNNLALDPTTGKVALPPQACESAAQAGLREGTLNKLDGFGTFETAIQVTFSEPVDASTIAGHILLFQTTPPTMIPTIPIVGTTLRFSAADCAAPAMVNAVTVVPMAPLEQKTTYIAVVTKGLKTATGGDFGPSSTWKLVSEAAPPVVFDPQGNLVTNLTPLVPGTDQNNNGVPDLDELQGLAKLFAGLQPMFMFLDAAGIPRDQTLVGWAFTTQTVTDPLDPTVAGSVANMLPTTGIIGSQSVTGGKTGEDFLRTATAQACLPLPSCCQADGGPFPCQAVGDVFGGILISPNFQQPAQNPLSGGNPVPGAWDDPVHPTKVGDAQIQVLAVIPKTPPPATGYPTLIFGHGLTSSKESGVAIAPQLAGLGIMTIAIDFQMHGSRAVKISDDPAKGCGGTPAPTVQPQCFAPFLSADLAGTRDNFRQTALDLERLVNALKACGTTACSSIKVDVDHMLYTGISLGGIMGTLTVASNPAFKSGVLNVPGVGLIDVLEHTQTLAISCSLVDALIDAGVLVGDKSNLAAAPPTGLCTTDAWKMQPGYLQFAAIARWVLDPADGANYTPKLAMRRILIQEVVGDQVVPNFATNTLGLLVGLTAMTADPATSATPPPSAAITDMPNTNKWVQYPTLPPSPPFPGNTFAHASLLRPANNNADGQLGTVRLQTDALIYINSNQ